MTTWTTNAEVLNLYDTPAIQIRHYGPFGKTALEITGKGIAGLMGETLTQLRDAKKIVPGSRPTFAEAMAHENAVAEKLNAISRAWADAHSVEFEIDGEKNPTGRVKIDGLEISDVRAHYSNDEG